MTCWIPNWKFGGVANAYRYLGGWIFCILSSLNCSTVSYIWQLLHSYAIQMAADRVTGTQNLNCGDLDAPFWVLGCSAFAPWVTMLIQGSTGTPKGTPWGLGFDFVWILNGFGDPVGTSSWAGYMFVLGSSWLNCSISSEVCFWLGWGA